MREQIRALQAELLTLPQVEPPTEHVFHGGMYCRQVVQPAGCLVVGKVHKREHFFMLVQGVLAVTEGDGVAEEIHAPFLHCSAPGTKRALLALTDVLYMTIHRTDATSVEEAEDELVEPDPTSPFLPGNKLKVLT